MDKFKLAEKYINFFEEEAYIAGGFVRDYLNDKPINDIDIYIAPERYSKMEIDLKKDGFKKINTYANMSVNIAMVYQKGDVQFVLTKFEPLAAISNEFDFGICHVAFNNKFELYAADCYKHDVDNKLLTMYIKRDHCNWQLGKSVGERRAKLLKKYNGYKFELETNKRNVEHKCYMRKVKL